MKKVFLTLVAVAVMVVMAYAAADIRNTKHNLASWSGNAYKASNYSEICVFCHTPHAAGAWPLWNRNYTAGTFTFYSTVTFDANATSLDDTSKLCFSCHETQNTYRTTNLYNNSNLVNNQAPNFNGKNITYAAAIGTDLRNDHPVAFNMAALNLTKYNEIYSMSQIASNIGDSQADLFPNNMFTCGSCHDVHGKVVGGTVIPVLLRRSNASSLLCLSCHAK